MSRVVSLDDIPPYHLLRRLLRVPRLIAKMREEFFRTLDLSETDPERLGIFRLKVLYNYRIEYMGKPEHIPGHEHDDIFVIEPEERANYGKIRILNGIDRVPINPNEVEFQFPDLASGKWFTVGPSRRKLELPQRRQALNRNLTTAQLLAITNPETVHRTGMPHIDPYIAAAHIAPMLGVDGKVITDAANAEDERRQRARNVLEFGFERKRTRKSGKRTRRTRRH